MARHAIACKVKGMNQTVGINGTGARVGQAGWAGCYYGRAGTWGGMQQQQTGRQAKVKSQLSSPGQGKG